MDGGDSIVLRLFSGKAGCMVEIIREIHVHGPFRLSTTVKVLRRESTPTHAPEFPAILNMSLEVPGGAVEARVVQRRPNTNLEVSILGDDADEEAAELVCDQLSRMLSLRFDPSQYFEQIQENPYLSNIDKVLPDLRPLLYPTPFEGVVTALIGSQLSPRETTMLLSNLREVCGIVPTGRVSASPAFPGKFTMLALPDRMLEIAGIPLLKVRMIKDVTAMMVGEPDLLEHLETVGDVERSINLLTTLPGINRYMALRLLNYAYGHPDLLLDSPMLRKSVQRFYRMGSLPDSSTIQRLAEPFIPWRSWWTFLLVTADEVAVSV